MKKDGSAHKRHSDQQLAGDGAEAVKEIAAEWKDKYLRAIADYQNLEKRHAREHVSHMKRANADVLRRLIPVGDMLDMVAKHLKDPGLDIVHKEWGRILLQEGVRRIETKGKPFDPQVMECVEVIEGEQDKVADEVLPGYMLEDTLLRPARVKVGKKKV